MSRKILSLAAVLILCLSITACAGPSQENQAKDAAVETTEAKAAPLDFKTEDGMLKITADENWSNAKETLGVEDAQLAVSRQDNAYIVLISEYKYNFAEGFSGFNELVIRHMEKSIDQDETSQTQALKLGEYDALKTTISGNVEGTDQTYEIYCAEINDRFVQLICWSSAKQQQKFAAEFDKIARSLSPVESDEE